MSWKFLSGLTIPHAFCSALPPSTTQPQAGDPWGAPAAYGAPAPAAPYGAPAPAAPFGAAAPAPALPYGAPPAADAFAAPPAAAYGAPPAPAYGAPTQDPYGAPAAAYGAPAPTPDQFGGPMVTPTAASAPSNPFGVPAAQPPQQMYGQPPAAEPSPFGTPAPTTISAGQDYTPASTIGFASPMAQQPTAVPEPAPAPFSTPAPAAEPALMSMNVLSGQAPNLVSDEPQTNGGTMADQAYAKLVNMDAFDLVKDKSEQRNPFEFSGSGSVATNTASLASMKKSSSVSLQELGRYFAATIFVV